MTDATQQEFDFYDVQCEDGSLEERQWSYADALLVAQEATKESGLWHEVHGVKVLKRVTP